MQPSLTSPAEAFHVRSMADSVTPNKSMSNYTQHLLSGQVPNVGMTRQSAMFQMKLATCLM